LGRVVAPDLRYLPSLGFNTTQQSWILNAFPIASIVGMFFSNQFADRNFSAEKFLASVIWSVDWPCLV
jgi:predicted MFS family arabinose efflux permease